MHINAEANRYITDRPMFFDSYRCRWRKKINELRNKDKKMPSHFLKLGKEISDAEKRPTRPKPQSYLQQTHSLLAWSS